MQWGEFGKNRMKTVNELIEIWERAEERKRSKEEEDQEAEEEDDQPGEAG